MSEDEKKQEAIKAETDDWREKRARGAAAAVLCCLPDIQSNKQPRNSVCTSMWVRVCACAR